MALRGEPAKEPPRSAITVARCDDELARLEKSQDEPDGRHAGARDDRAGSSFERGDGFAEEVARRICGPRVVVGTRHPERLERVVDRKMDRRNDGSVRA